MDAQVAKGLLSFVEEVSPRLRGPEGKELLLQLEHRYGELLSALQWYIEHGHSAESFRLSSSMVTFWMATKRMQEGSEWFDRVLALSGGDDGLRGRALFDAGYLAFWRGEYNQSFVLQNRAVELGRQANNRTVTALALVGLARIALRTDVEEARRLCREAIAVTEGTDDRAGRSSAMHVLGVAAQMAGDLDEAREIMGKRIALGREMGNLAIVSVESNNLSMVERQLGNLDRAEVLSREALEISYERGDAQSIPWNVNGLAAVARGRGDFDRAARLVGVADATMHAAGGEWPPDERQHYDRTVAALTEAMGLVEFERERGVGRSMTTSEGVTFALGARTE